jgi:hypothetical protein
MKRLFYPAFVTSRHVFVTFLSAFVTVLFSLSALAQNEGINFQGVARNTAGEVLVSQKINLRLSILLGSETGAVAYMETRQVTTNPQGVFAVVVGDDKALTKSTNFSSINWTPSPKFIKVEMDPNAGANYLVMGTSRLQAVPFAFYANGVDASNVKGVLPLSSGGTGVASMTELKKSLGLDVFNNAALETKVDKVAGKGLSTNDYTTAEKNKLEAITGTNTGDQDLSGYATTTQLAAKANTADVTTSLATKANSADVTTSLATKANSADVTTSLATKANAADVTTSLATKANTADVTTSLATKANTADVTTSLATKANTVDVTTSLASKANASDVTTSLATKVDKVTGKELSTNDYTTAEKTKLAAITGTNTGDQVNITGNAGTATILQNARTINGVAFDGSANITLPTPAAGIPYTGATDPVNLGAFDLTVNEIKVGRGGGNNNSNIAIGRNTMTALTSGGDLTVIGTDAYKVATAGGWSTAIGSQSLVASTGSYFNTAVGYASMQNLTVGGYNTGVGVFSLSSVVIGSSNVGIGYAAGANFAAASNTISIGYYAQATADNTIQLGNVDMRFVRSAGAFYGPSFNVTSDLRLKTNIAPLQNSIAAIMQLKPVSYEKKTSLASNNYSTIENGFIAQDLQKVMPSLVTEGTDNDKLLSVNYTALIPVLTKALQEQQKQIEDQNAKIAAQQKQIEELIKLVKGQ